ncbi:hypothetical protein [Herpetosiphon geysericola]|uniref:Uncharacterized protein n=1 Tax=Herpetosiphon geysericola TaxID=70996 RepID=A0A0P6XEU1_9CHLR|nr:hypothetical protein [Herpetosiphon geysericola]KPL81736.1 hypothetical protein SE18_20575 [Herpetosiphon geysericola]
MGASGWNYFVPYQADLQAAFEQLQAEVLQSGDFSKGGAWWEGLALEEYLPPEDLSPDDIEDYRQELEALQRQTYPTTIEQWRKWNEPDGTHSILDIERVVDKISPLPRSSHNQDDPEAAHQAFLEQFAVIAPMPEDLQREIFGTTRPTKAQIMAHESAISDHHDSFQGFIIIAYENDQPHELCFIGFSGD